MTSKSAAVIDHLIDVAEGKVPKPTGQERRGKRRHRYDATVALVLIEPGARVGRPMAVAAKDLSLGGICVYSRSMMYPGSRGALQLVRSNGQMAIVGVQVRHCRYVNDMKHEVGFKFIPMADELDARAFLDRRGRMIVLAPTSKQD